MEANRGAGSPSNSQVEGKSGSLELEREKNHSSADGNSVKRAGRAERDPEVERGEALKHYSKMLHGAIPKFPHDAEVPVWFETVECLFLRYAVPVDIQAHLVYLLITTRLANLCASMKDGEFMFGHLRSVVLAELRLFAEEYRKRFTAASKRRGEMWKQFATRVSSYLQYYLEAKGVIEFTQLLSLLVADHMKDTMGEGAREYGVPCGDRQARSALVTLTGTVWCVCVCRNSGDLPRDHCIATLLCTDSVVQGVG
ncbi:hypothetical protein HPB47_000590 [Ixodes persulcatus]|uniref:Uncharacterized protein n=1 Tax=Ixodes persulcatus TaxID=34615 RepID=A0AC60PRN4_IXOPE|nr:hypothetical protein HPB47_000590 [Ixodes persulcatus]